MKKITSILIVGFGCSSAAYSQSPCSPTVIISSDITANRIFSDDSLYRIQGCISVRNNATLTIQAGATVTFSDNDFLIIRKDGYINAQGTSGNTIKFTSTDVAGSRIPRNGGLIVEGDGVINKSPVTLSCAISHSSGMNNTDSSGILSYMEIHYLSGSPSVADINNGLSLVGVGSKTVLDHIQVSNSAGNGIAILGGAPNMKNVFALDCSKAGLRMVYGYVGSLQNVLLIQKNTTMHHATGTYGILVENNPTTPTATPITNFTGSNFTILGIKYCATGTVSSDYRDGIRFDNNAAGSLYNSFISGSNLYGLYINDVGSAQHTNNSLNVSHCSFNGNSSGNYGTAVSSWSGNGCSASITSWITGSTSTGCEETGNQLGIFDAAYDPSFCSDYCSGTFVKNFVTDAANTELDPPVYTGLPAFFSTPDYRGAIQNTDITNAWSTLCPQSLKACTTLLRNKPELRNNGLFISPNPARQYADVQFECEQQGTATIIVTDKVSGRTWYRKEIRIQQRGTQKVQIPVGHFPPDIYTLQLHIGKQLLYGKLVIE